MEILQNQSNEFKGSLNLIIGPMYSGKTSTLITRYNRHTIAKRKCIMIKYKNDTRYDDTMIVTHDGIKVKAIPCYELASVDSIVQNYDVVCIDEVQFYKDASVFCDKWANQGLIVEACGLNGTFERKPFDVVSMLIPKCNNLIYLTAICRTTGLDANYSRRNTSDTEEELIGGSDIYSAANRITFYKNKNWSAEAFIEYFSYYCKCNKLITTDIINNKLKKLKIKGTDNFKKIITKLFSKSISEARMEMDGKIIVLRAAHEYVNSLKSVLTHNPSQVFIILNSDIHDISKCEKNIRNTFNEDVVTWDNIEDNTLASKINKFVIIDENNYLKLCNNVILMDKLKYTFENIGDIFVNDVYDSLNTNNENYFGIGMNCKEKYIGDHYQESHHFLDEIFFHVGRKVAIFNGTLKNYDAAELSVLMSKINSLVILGEAALPFLQHSFKINFDTNFIKGMTSSIIEHAKRENVNIILPLDIICKKKDALESTLQMDIKVNLNIENFVYCDIGPNTVDFLDVILNDANIIYWSISNDNCQPNNMCKILETIKKLTETNKTISIGSFDDNNMYDKHNKIFTYSYDRRHSFTKKNLHNNKLIVSSGSYNAYSSKAG
jgi:thymidine kinase